ncbi:uncharacterized protein LOC121807007 [Salvia splendens]|uniref:uncharacterized protein LOC121807007 n=1 Tax=Salvia splendens TaxID=180675 RepID=UPI001C251794|nr:uncharacterized protein LOC121807007 [Salvia splendens]
MSCYTDGGGVFARRTASCASAPSSAPSSPRSRVKFLCSHGGKILPRPSDGQLKYVGGETRVISVPRDISFKEAMKRLTYMMEGEMVLRYQLATEDLDALVTVKSDEDLGNMFDEVENYQMMGFPRMRTFLFPVHNHKPNNNNNNNMVMDDQLTLDQCYIFSINGLITPRHLSNSSKRTRVSSLASSACTSPRSRTRVSSLASSACTSPRSPDSYAAEAHTFGNIQRIQSSPSICNLLNIPQQNHYSSPPTHHQQQLPPQYYHTNSFRSPSPMRSGAARLQQDNSAPPTSYYNPSRDPNRGGGIEHCNKCKHQ